jgi:hypothetical protein
MNKNKIVLCIGLIWMLFSIPTLSFAQDSLKLERKFSTEIQKELADDEDFNYIERKNFKLNQSNGFWAWFRDLMNKYFSTAYNNRVTEWIIYLIAFVIMIWVIIKLAMGSSNSAIELSNAGRNRLFEDLKEVDANFDFELAISAAIQDNDYNLALRYQFIKTLFHLEKQSLLRLRPGKTNRDYVKEISKTILVEDFEPVSNIIEKVLYGGYILDLEDYKSANQKCLSILNQTKI